MEEVSFPFLLPHELLSKMLSKKPDVLKKLTALKSEPLDMLHTEWGKKFGICKDILIPMGTFGDGVPHQKNKSIE
eukprot:12041022-Alexandrium_andersonii.AAC.1